MIKNKLAISAIIGEVLLISLALVMAGATYAWLKFYVSKPLPTESCDEAVNLIISEHQCDAGQKLINITFRNQGRFDINGVLVKISNTTEALAIWPLTEIRINEEGAEYDDPRIHMEFNNSVLIPGEEQMKKMNYSKYNKITLLEIEPTKGVDKYGRMIICEKSISRIPINC